MNTLQSKTSEPIEKRELRGISLKSLYWIIGSTIFLCGSIFGSCSKISKGQDDLRNDFKILKIEMAAPEGVKELRMKIMERRLDIMDETLKGLQKLHEK